MHWRIISAVLFFCFLNPARAEVFEDWGVRDTQRQAIYSTLHVLDWMQTRYIAKHPEEFHETNRNLGRHPSTREVDRHFIALGTLQLAAVALLPTTYRAWFQTATIYVEASAVQGNMELGIGFSF